MVLALLLILAVIPLLGIGWIAVYGSLFPQPTVDALFMSLILLTMSGILGATALFELRKRRFGSSSTTNPAKSTSPGGLVRSGKVKEVVFFADRCDISEEITRLTSHLNQFRDCLKSDEPVGRTLDFLAQEIGREINTIGSKANAAEISQQVVKMKAELEKIREQIQNIE